MEDGNDRNNDEHGGDPSSPFSTKRLRKEDDEANSATPWSSYAHLRGRVRRIPWEVLTCTSESAGSSASVTSTNGAPGITGAQARPPAPSPITTTTSSGASSSSGLQRRRPELVLYWMQTALRGAENPALDVALLHARAQRLPLIVATFVLRSHPHLTWRRAAFWLQGAADVSRQLEARGIRYVLHVETNDGSIGAQNSVDGWSALKLLAQRSALVITEDMPVEPQRPWTQRLAMEITPVPLMAVDCACLVPMESVPRAYERAYAYRYATSAAREAALQMSSDGTFSTLDNDASLIPSRGDSLGTAGALDVGFEPVPIGAMAEDELMTLAAECATDVLVRPVPGSVGGTDAATRRWEDFVMSDGLMTYAERRNNALSPESVSRMSAYNHWGMISPFRLARDAVQALRSSGASGKDGGGGGAKGGAKGGAVASSVNRGNGKNGRGVASRGDGGPRKFIDEFVVWRELSYSFCHRRYPEHNTLYALPEWARQSLEKHRDDDRPERRTFEQLEAAQSGDAVWDAAQRTLLLRGELHNNLRMTWGKAVISWAPAPLEALRWVLHLNDKYALDGCDPCTFGGILWCFGQFDSPHSPDATRITGRLRLRPTSKHKRILERYVETILG